MRIRNSELKYPPLYEILQGQDAKRTWLYFPLFSFFEQNIDGKIPNEFALPFSPADVTSLLEK
jgi:hypothetical protein